jgi:hypothetical protein
VVRRALWPADRVRNEADRHAGDAEGRVERQGTRAPVTSSLAQRITSYVEPHYVGDDQLRGYEDEAEVRRIYAERFAPVTRSASSRTTAGASPSAIRRTGSSASTARSRRSRAARSTKFRRSSRTSSTPRSRSTFSIQVQTGLLVSERQWCDFVSYCGGLHAPVIRAYPDPKVQDAIVAAAGAFEKRLADTARSNTASRARRRGHAADPHRTQG